MPLPPAAALPGGLERATAYLQCYETCDNDGATNYFSQLIKYAQAGKVVE